MCNSTIGFGSMFETELLPLFAMTADLIKAKGKVNRIHARVIPILIFASVQLARLSV